MNEIETEIYRLASLGLNPSEIEKTLGLPRYHIHEQYHAVLMKAYESSFSSERAEEETTSRYVTYYQRNKQKILSRKRESYLKNGEAVRKYQREYWHKNKEKIIARKKAKLLERNTP